MTRCWPVITMQFATAPPMEPWAVFSSMVAELPGFAGVEESGDGPLDPGEHITGARVFFGAVEGNPESGAIVASEHAEAVRHLAEAWLPSGIIAALSSEAIPDADWGVAWRAYFKLLRVTDRIYCGPPWDAKLPPGAPADAVVLQIDPGQAFGTGTHETTQLCLQILEQEIRPGEVLFDVGTGSGILSIGAVLLGAARAIGTEYDPVTEDNFHLNAGINRVVDQLEFVLSGDPAEALRKAGNPSIDLVVCNMLSTRFLPLLGGLRQADARLILSGFLLTERGEVRAAAEAAGFSVVTEHSLGDWAAYVCDPV